jgi:hypothetical protein
MGRDAMVAPAPAQDVEEHNFQQKAKQTAQDAGVSSGLAAPAWARQAECRKAAHD